MMYFTNIGDEELGQFHNLVRSDFQMTLTDVLGSDLFKVETIVSDSLFKVYPLFYCDSISSSNYDDKILDNKCIICKKESDTVLSFNTLKEAIGDVVFGYGFYNGVAGFVVYCYDVTTNTPLAEIPLTVETSNKSFTGLTGNNGAYTYIYNGERLFTVKYGEIVLYQVVNGIDYIGNGLISSDSQGNLTGTDLKLKFEDGTIISYVDKNSLDYNLGDGLHTLEILGTLTILGSDCFYGCTGLTSVNLPVVENLGSGCFESCTGLTSVDLPSVTSLGSGCFYYCTGLTSVSLSSATTLGDYCFWGCTGLTSITLPDTVTSIGDRCFSVCSSLATVNLYWTTSESIVTYNSTWIDGAFSGLKFTIPNGTQSLYESKGYPSSKLVERSE